MVFSFFWLSFGGATKYGSVLRAVVFYAFVVAFWQVLVLSFSCLVLRPAMVFPFFELFFLGEQKRWISVSGTVFGASFGLRAMVFCGFVF